jgi:tripartite ATP-independent transporter DctP family solute receptor
MLGRAALAGGMMLACAMAAGAQEHVWKFAWASVDSPTDPNAVTAHEFKKAVEELSGGRIRVDLYPNRQLGDEKAAMEGLRFGTVESATIVTATLASLNPGFMVADLPFLFADEKMAHEILDGPIGSKLAATLDQVGIKHVGWMELGFRHMVNNVRPIASPKDVAGVKFRVIQSPIFIEMFSALGGAAVPMAWGEMFPALQQGAIDGMEAPLSILEANKLYELGKYLSLTGHTYAGGGFLVSKIAFDKLSPELQEIVQKAGKVASAAQRARMAEHNKTLLESLEKHGMTVNRINDIKEFRDAVAPVYEYMKKEAGEDLVNEILAAVSQK